MGGDRLTFCGLFAVLFFFQFWVSSWALAWLGVLFTNLGGKDVFAPLAFLFKWIKDESLAADPEAPRGEIMPDRFEVEHYQDVLTSPGFLCIILAAGWLAATWFEVQAIVGPWS